MAWARNGAFIPTKPADADGYVRARLADSRMKGQSRVKMTDGELELQRSSLPATSCFRCEARGWCEHRGPGDA